MTVIGSSGALGNALTIQLAANNPQAIIHAAARKKIAFDQPNITHVPIHYGEEESISKAAKLCCSQLAPDLVIVATGILHTNSIMPEKSLDALSASNLHTLFEANTVFPALVFKHFTPYMRKANQPILVALSARVGSISDNRLGGWYGYRASKAALNMIIKNTAIELKRYNKTATVAGIHPGTVDSDLSRPFQSNVPTGKLFSPEKSAQEIIKVINKFTPNDTGKCIAWDGTEIAP